jgi:cell division inhibitor SepF
VSAFRKAGVWLGLIEDEDDDRAYDDRYADDDYREPAYRDRDRDRDAREARSPRGSRFAEELAEDDDDLDEAPAVPRARGIDRADLLAERASVRSITRPAAPAATPSTSSSSHGASSHGGGSSSFATRDNLALAPQVQLRERAVVAEDVERRYQITTLHPTTYNEARTIGEHFRDGVPVIMNLTEMDEADAKRLVDFAAGLAFGLRGTIERVTNRVFLLSPANVQVTAEDKAKIAEGGFFNQS